MSLFDTIPLVLSRQVADRMSYTYGGDIHARCIEHTLQRNCIRICEMAFNLRKGLQWGQQIDSPSSDFYASAINNIESISYYYMLPCNLPPCVPVSNIKKRFLFRTLFDIHHFPGLYHVTELLDTGVFDDYSEDEYEELNRNFGRSISKKTNKIGHHVKKKITMPILHEVVDIKLKGITKTPANTSTAAMKRIIQPNNPTRPRARDPLMKQLNTIAITTAMIEDIDKDEDISKSNQPILPSSTAAKSDDNVPLLTINHKQEAIRSLQTMTPCSIFDAVKQFVQRDDFRPPVTREKWEEYSSTFLVKRTWGKLRTISYEQVFLICNLLKVEASPDFLDLNFLTQLICECLAEQGVEIIPEYKPIFHSMIKEKVQTAIKTNSMNLTNLLAKCSQEDLQNILIVTKGHRDLITDSSAPGFKLLFRKWRELTITDYIIRSSEPTPEATLYALTESRSLGTSRRKEKNFAATTMMSTMQYFLDGVLPTCHPLITEALDDLMSVSRTRHNFISEILNRVAKKDNESSEKGSNAMLSESSASSFDLLFKDFQLTGDGSIPQTDELSEDKKALIVETLTLLGHRVWMQRVCDMYALVTKLGPFLHRTESSGIRVIPLSPTSYFVDYMNVEASYLVSASEIPKSDSLYRFTDGWTKYTQQSCNDLWFCPFPVDDRIHSHYSQLFYTIVAFAITLAITEPRVPPTEIASELGYLALFGLERSSITAHVITGCKYLYSTAVNCLNYTAKNILSDYFQAPNMTFVSGYFAWRCLVYMQYYSSLQKKNMSSKFDNPLSESKYDESITKCSNKQEHRKPVTGQLNFATRSTTSPKVLPSKIPTGTGEKYIHSSSDNYRSLTVNSRRSKLGAKTQAAKLNKRIAEKSPRSVSANYSPTQRDCSPPMTEDIMFPTTLNLASSVVSNVVQTKSQAVEGTHNPTTDILSQDTRSPTVVSGSSKPTYHKEPREEPSSFGFQTRSLFSSKLVSARLCLQLLLMSSCINGSPRIVDLLAESTINRKIDNELKALRVLTGLCISQSRSLYDNITSFGFQYVSDFIKPPGTRLYLRECKSHEHIIDAEIRLIKLLSTCRIPYAYSPSVVMAAGQLLFINISGTRLLHSLTKMNEEIIQLSSTERSIGLQPPCFLRGKLPYSTSGGGVMVATGSKEKKKVLELQTEDEAFYIKSLLINNTDISSRTMPLALFPSWPTINLYIPTLNTIAIGMAHEKIQENIIRDSHVYGKNMQMNETLFTIFQDVETLNKCIQAENAELYYRVQKKLSSICSIEELVSLDWRLSSLLYRLPFSDEEFFSGSSASADLTFKFIPASEVITLSIRVGLFMQLHVETEILSNCSTIGMVLAALQESLNNLNIVRTISVYFDQPLVDHILAAIMSPKFHPDKKLTQRDVINILGLTDPNNLQVATLQATSNNSFYETKLSSNVGHAILTRHVEGIAELFLSQFPENYGHSDISRISEFTNLTGRAQAELAAIHESASLSSLTESLMPTLFYTMMLPAKRFLNSYFDSCALNYMMSEEKLIIFEDGFVSAISTGYITGIEPHQSGSAIRIHTNIDEEKFQWHSSLLHIGLTRLRRYLLDQFCKKEYQLDYATMFTSCAMINKTNRYTCLIMNTKVIDGFTSEKLKDLIKLIINKIATYGQILCELASFNPMASSTIVSRAYAEFDGVYYMRGSYFTNTLESIFTMCSTAFREYSIRDKMLQIITIGSTRQEAEIGAIKSVDHKCTVKSSLSLNQEESFVNLPRLVRRYLYRCMQKKFEKLMFPQTHPIRHYFELDSETEAISLIPVVLGGLPSIEIVEAVDRLSLSKDNLTGISDNSLILVDILNRALILKTAIETFSRYNVGIIYRRFIKLYKLWKQYDSYRFTDIYIGNIPPEDIHNVNLSPRPIKGLIDPATAFKSFNILAAVNSRDSGENASESAQQDPSSVSESEISALNQLKSILSDTMLDNSLLDSIKEHSSSSLSAKLHHPVPKECDRRCRNRKHQLEILSCRYWMQRTSCIAKDAPLEVFLYFLAQDSALAIYDGQSVGMTALIYKLIEDVLDYDI